MEQEGGDGGTGGGEKGGGGCVSSMGLVTTVPFIQIDL